MNYFISYRTNGIFLSPKIDSDLFDDDDYDPPNLGGRRPLDAEWGDYITEEQEFYMSSLADGSIAPRPLRRKRSRKHSPEEIVEMLATIVILRNEGVTMREVLSHLDISPATYTRWKSDYKNLVFSSVKSGDVHAEQVA
jgi:hypothetical protein